MKHHSIFALPAGVLSVLNMPEALRHIWQNDIYQQIYYNTNYRKTQETLPVTVPYVILKGTSAAKYYPYPAYRIMGDIDIITRREDFETAYHQLQDHGYRIVKKFERKRQIPERIPLPPVIC